MKTIDRLRELLDSFYEGNASEKDISEIRAIFDSQQELPDDLAADRDVFQAMSDPRLDDVPVPEDVEKLVLSTVDDLGRKGDKKKPVLILWLKVSGIAAAVALILALGVHFMHRGDLELSDPGIITASADTARACVEAAGIAEKSVDDVAERELAVAETVTPPHNGGVTIKKKTASDVKVVTDPEEAGEYVLMAMNLLSENISRAGQAAEEPANAINMMNQTLNDILK